MNIYLTYYDCNLIWLQTQDDGYYDKKYQLADCEKHGENYKRCDPDKVKPKNEEKCEITDDYACNKKYWKKSTNKGKDKKSKKTIEEEKDYCECMGLDYYEPDDFVLTQLRGAVKAQSS